MNFENFTLFPSFTSGAMDKYLSVCPLPPFRFATAIPLWDFAVGFFICKYSGVQAVGVIQVFRPKGFRLKCSEFGNPTFSLRSTTYARNLQPEPLQPVSLLFNLNPFGLNPFSLLYPARHESSHSRPSRFLRPWVQAAMSPRCARSPTASTNLIDNVVLSMTRRRY